MSREPSTRSSGRPDLTREPSTRSGGQPDVTRERSTPGGGQPDVTRERSTPGGGQPVVTRAPSTRSSGQPDVTPAPSTHGGARPDVSRALVVGVGCSLGCPSDELAALVGAALEQAIGTPVAVATVDRRAAEPCVLALARNLGVPLRTYPAAALAAVPVPTPSRTVERHVGTPSVAEAAAILAALGELVVTKRRSEHATCAIAEENLWPE